MNDKVIVNFDEKPCVVKPEPCRLTLQARTEHIVNVPTNYKGLGILDKTELPPGVFLAASLTKGANGVSDKCCNTTTQDQTVVIPQVDLENLSEGESSVTLALLAVAEGDNRSSSLRKLLRLQHLNIEERVSIVEICEE